MSVPLLGCGTGAGTGTGGPGTTYATLDGTVNQGTVDAAKLTYTHNAAATGMARSTAAKNSGKWYFEVTAVSNISAQNDCVGVIKTGTTDTRVVDSGLDCGVVFQGVNGLIFANDTAPGPSLGSNITNGDIIGCAIDLDNDKVWFRKAPSGNWNGQAIGSQDPAGNVGGCSISNYSATTMVPALGFWSTISSGVWTANFGASAFTGTVPTGFTSGWTV